jgi:YolD-like protein
LLRDRGSKKWQGFFLPEHVKMLKDLRNDYYKAPRPELDESQIEEMEKLILESLENQVLLNITTWKNGFFASRVATVTKIDPINKKIQIQDGLDSKITLDFFQITNVMTK